MAKWPFTVCGILLIGGKVLLVRHTYGVAEGRILLPGGHVNAGELATAACEREILEETGVTAKVSSLYSMQFNAEQWCAVFTLDYEGGTPRTDGYENSEVLLLDPAEAVMRPDITNMSRTILEAYLQNADGLPMSDYVPASKARKTYALFQAVERETE